MGLTGSILHYRILEKIGEGGMGVVYKALDTRLDRPVAVKTLAALPDAKSRRQFVWEARADARSRCSTLPPNPRYRGLRQSPPQPPAKRYRRATFASRTRAASIRPSKPARSRWSEATGYCSKAARVAANRRSHRCWRVFGGPRRA